MKERLSKNSRQQIKSNNEHSLTINRAVIPFPIPESKWRDIFEVEYNTFTVNSILNEIISITMRAIYDVYLEKTVYSFVVHCSHLAWLQLFDAMDLEYDLGENTASIKKFWAGDKELKSPPIDSLCFKNVEIRAKLKTSSFCEHNQESLS